MKLIERLIKLHSDEGDLVLDPFMGSGTTAVAAARSGRDYIGFETEKKYYDVCVERLNGDE